MSEPTTEETLMNQAYNRGREDGRAEARADALDVEAVVKRVHKQFDRWRDGNLPNELLRDAVIRAILNKRQP